MDAMKEALMKKMMELKSSGKGPLEAISSEANSDQGDKSDELAPDISDSEDNNGAEDMGDPKIDPLTGKSIESQMDPEHLEILKALTDGAPQGRPANGLHERAAMGAKNKMAEMHKRKK